MIINLQPSQIKYVEDPVNCSFEGMTYRETAKGGPETPISLTVVNNKVVLKNTQEVWCPPEKGFVKFVFQEVVAKPTINDALQDKYLDLLMKIVEAGKDSDRKKDNDKKRIWLYLLCQDVHLTTKQVNNVVFYLSYTVAMRLAMHFERIWGEMVCQRLTCSCLLLLRSCTGAEHD